MNAIEGIDLKECVANARAELLADTRSKVQGYIKHMLAEIDRADSQIRHNETELAKAQNKKKALEETLTKIIGGDWTALREPKPEGKVAGKDAGEEG